MTMAIICCSVKEAMQASGLGRTKLYELMDAGKLQSVKIGERRLINWKSLEKLLTPAQMDTDRTPKE
jgi:excisionase family DNA binding protein